tara:strand:- start:1957 stop:2094 length:138 start_codon:yes stop_codon:yes gene_type:complete
MPNPKAQLRESGAPVICGLCGGTERSGCLLNSGMDIHACPQFKPL